MSTPERTTAAAFPRYLHGEVLADSASLQWPGFTCGAIAFRAWWIVSSCLRPRAVDLLRSRGLGGVPGARGRRGLDDAADPARPYFRHPLEDALRSALQFAGRGGTRNRPSPHCGGSVPRGLGSGVSRQDGRSGSDRFLRTRRSARASVLCVRRDALRADAGKVADASRT